MAKSFETQINDLLDDFYQLVRDEYEGAAKDVADECVVRLKNVKWKTKTGKNYSQTWRVKKRRWGAYTVHNSKNYQLTHLLENGHIVVNKKGTYGRAPAYKHIEPVYEWAQDEIEREIRQRIERAQGGIYG